MIPRMAVIAMPLSIAKGTSIDPRTEWPKGDPR